VYFEGARLPASYANFYIANEVVLVPVFDDPNDERALGILREVFRGREVIGLRGREMIVGLGAIHCVTQQEPAMGAQRA
jgi:agmatine deiminase